MHGGKMSFSRLTRGFVTLIEIRRVTSAQGSGDCIQARSYDIGVECWTDRHLSPSMIALPSIQVVSKQAGFPESNRAGITVTLVPSQGTHCKEKVETSDESVEPT